MRKIVKRLESFERSKRCEKEDRKDDLTCQLVVFVGLQQRAGQGAQQAASSWILGIWHWADQRNVR